MPWRSLPPANAWPAPAGRPFTDPTAAVPPWVSVPARVVFGEPRAVLERLPDPQRRTQQAVPGPFTLWGMVWDGKMAAWLMLSL
jgi:hypothetical protein